MSKRKLEEDTPRRFKEKHSLDSDEEEEDKEEHLADEDIEGQEDDTIDNDEGIKITPFNMKEELEEGHFDKDGMYIFGKKDEIRDEWMDNIDWVQIKHRQTIDAQPGMESDSDSEPEKLDLKPIYSGILEHVKPGESVAKALRRLGNKGKPMTSAQRWKAKKHKADTGDTEPTAEDTAAAERQQHFLALTELADTALQDGNMEIYEMTYEKLTFDLKHISEAQDKGQARVTLPQDMDDDDALDMFADDFDKKEGDNEAGRDAKQSGRTAGGTGEPADKMEEAEPGNKTGADEPGDKMGEATPGDKTGADEPGDKTGADEPEKKGVGVSLAGEVMWEYRWENQDAADIHGPHSSSDMLKWTEDGYFPDGVFCRKVGTDTQFYTSRRIDFDLYT